MAPPKKGALPEHLKYGMEGINRARALAPQPQISADDASLEGRAIIPYTAGYVIPSFSNSIHQYSNFYLPELGRQNVRQFLKTIQTLDPASRAQAYESVIGGMGAHIAEVANVLAALGAYATADTAAMEKYSGVEKFIANHEVLKDTKEFRDKGAARMAPLQKTIVANWGSAFRDEVVLPFSHSMWLQEKVLKRLQYICQIVSPKQAAPFVNKALLVRVSNPAKGKSNKQHLIGADFINLKTNLRT
jgi:hypothetical protein